MTSQNPSRRREPGNSDLIQEKIGGNAKQK
jgi:hypothetical protein